jgi:DNA-binding FadR family transcriptional regulator
MTLKSLQPVKRPPLLHVEVQEAIKNHILENRLKANDPLPSEGELASQLGVSRNSVREAVKALESIGILETRRGSGLFLRNFSFEPLLDNLPYGLMFGISELAELLELRQTLEVGLIEAAIEAMTEQTLLQLQKTVESMRTHAEREEEFLEDDRLFHQLLYENHGNRMLLRLLDTFWVAFRRASDEVKRTEDKPLSTYRDHALILKAIEKRDIPAAKDALTRHYEGIHSRLRAAKFETNSSTPTTGSLKV